MGKATVILAAVVSIFLTPFAVSAKHITLMWDDEINTKHDGYRIFYGQASHANARMPGEPPAPYDYYIDVQNPEARSHKIDIPVGTWYFRVQTIGTVDGQEFNSVFSNELGDRFLFSPVSEIRITIESP